MPKFERDLGLLNKYSTIDSARGFIAPEASKDENATAQFIRQESIRNLPNDISMEEALYLFPPTETAKLDIADGEFAQDELLERRSAKPKLQEEKRLKKRTKRLRKKAKK